MIMGMYSNSLHQLPLEQLQRRPPQPQVIAEEVQFFV
jgi:hypothetical protein